MHLDMGAFEWISRVTNFFFKKKCTMRCILLTESQTKNTMSLQKLLLSTLFALLLNCALYAQPPKAEQAFIPSLTIVDPNTLSIRINMLSDVYLYQDKIRLSGSAEVELGEYSLPKPQEYATKQGKHFLVYQNQLTFNAPILGKQALGTLTLSYQGCATDGFCYPPQTKQINVQFSQHGGLLQATWQNTDAPVATSPASQFSQHSLWFIGASFLLFGILLSFTPCVLPMIPVLIGIISGHGQLSTGKGFLLGSAYTMGIALSYSAVGAVFAYFGQNLQVFMQGPTAIISFAILFMVLAISSMGILKITLPTWIQSHLANLNYHLPKNSLLGAFGMGALSTLILSPCVTPPLVGAVSFMVQTGNLYLGAFALFCMGIGIGLPLIALSTAAGRYLPKAGHWMEQVRFLISYILLGVAVFLICKLLSPMHSKMLIGLYVFFAGVLFGAFRRATNLQQAFKQGITLLLVLYGLCLMLGASLGSASYLHPLGRVYSGKMLGNSTIITVNKPWTLREALAQSNGMKRALFFTADWCVSCATQKEVLEKYSTLWKKRNLLFIFVDVTKQNSGSKRLESRYQVIAPPTVILLDEQGKRASPNYVGDDAITSLALALQSH